MMKNIIYMLLCFLIFSCKKKEEPVVEEPKVINNYRLSINILEYQRTTDTMTIKINGAKGFIDSKIKTGDFVEVIYHPGIGTGVPIAVNNLQIYYQPNEGQGKLMFKANCSCKTTFTNTVE